MANPIDGASTASAVTLYIYDGEGTSGSLLATVNGNTPVSTNEYVNFDLSSAKIYVISGNKYTMSLTTASVTVGWLDLSFNNRYTSGLTGIGDVSYDFLFNTYVKAVVNDSYLPISGGTLTGDVTFSSNVSGITKAMVGLDAVDNTSDLDKPISTLTQTALNNKLNSADAKFIDLSTDQTVSGVKTFKDGIKFFNTSGSNANIDQSNTTSDGGAGSTTQWQSFTAGTTGLLSAVEWKMANPIDGASTASAVTLYIYDGEGTSGSLLATVNGNTPVSTNEYVNFDLSSAKIYVISGNKYTMSLTTASVTVGWLDLSFNNRYTSGLTGIGDVSYDFLFNTYVKAVVNDSYLPISGGTLTGDVTFSSNVSGITKAMVGLNAVDNTSDVDKPISTATQTALDLKAPLASPTFTGTPTLPTGTIGVTQTAGDSTTALATTAFVQTGLNTKFTYEVSDEATATVGQTSFILSKTPGTNSKVKMFINGIRISNTAYSISGTTLTYVPSYNGAYALIAGDRIQFDFSY